MLISSRHICIRSILCCEYCDCVDSGNEVELFGETRGGGINQDICVLLEREPCAGVGVNEGYGLCGGE